MPVRTEPVSTSIRPDQVRILAADEFGDALQHAAAAAQVAGAGDRQMKCRAGAGGIADVVDKQSHGSGSGLYPFGRPSQYTGSMSQRDPIRVFVTHCFEEGDDYLRVFEYLESAQNFYYNNCSAPEVQPADGWPGSAARGAAPADHAGRSGDRFVRACIRSSRTCWCSS